MRRKKLKVTIIGLLLCVPLLLAGKPSSAQRDNPPNPSKGKPLFSPSNAQTEDGRLIPVEQFISSSRCASCHQDTHRAWSQSLHRNAAREPFYRESVDILLRTRGIELTRHCESCHTPVALFSGALSKDSPRQQAPFTPLDHEGVTCSVCHSITEARLNGTGSYTIRRPALLAKEDGTPIYSEFTDEQILADIPGHKRAVMRPLLRQPEFCATCHKVDAPPSLNSYKHIRGFSAYDEWQQSGASHEAITPFYRREQRTDCRACHMPKIESHQDRAAKAARIASHQWLGANTAVPLFYDQQEQAKLTEEFLKKDVLAIDIFALRKDANSDFIAPLSSDKFNCISFTPGEEITAEVVVANRNAAHSFPPEVRDLYEAWVEFTVTDDTRKTIFKSGDIQPNGMLDESAHVYKAVLLDESGRYITRHQIWTTNIKAYDNTIQAGRSDVVRFRFRVPENGKRVENLTLRARVNYRRVNQEYTNYVLTQQRKKMTLPVVQMADAETRITAGAMEAASTPVAKSIARRWNDYGIGLLEQAQYGAASEAFRRASEADPTDPMLLVNAAIAEMKTERFAPEREQFRKAAVLLDAAIKLDPENLRTRYFRALVWRADGKLREAAAELEQIACFYPRDREVQRQLGQTLYTLGQMTRARLSFEAILGLDPTDFGAWQLLNPIYLSEGRTEKATHAQQMYWQWRDDPRADGIAARFFAAHPQWADERVLSHTHGEAAPQRPVLTGTQATPDK